MNIWSLLSGGGTPQAPPPRVPTDEVVPLFGFDDNPIYRKIIMLFMMRFDDVLDPDILHDSLVKLLSLDGWRRLGARLRLHASTGKLEYHIPERYTEDRPAVTYTHVSYDTTIGEHPVASRLPRGGLPVESPSVVSDAQEFVPLMRDEARGPRSIRDFLYEDRPQLSLHVVSFRDATLVSLNWCHTLLDTMGRHELLRAWAAVVNNNNNSVDKRGGGDGEGEVVVVRPLFAPQTDPFASLGNNATEPYYLADRQLSPWATARFLVRSAWELFVSSNPRDDENRILCLPAAFVRREKASANAHAAAAKAKQEEASTNDNDMASSSNPGFVSEGDVISSILVRLLLLADYDSTGGSSSDSRRTVAVSNYFGLRWLLAGDIDDENNQNACLPKDMAYVGNAAITVTALLRAVDVVGEKKKHSTALAETAMAVRRSIAVGGSRAQVEAKRAVDKGLARPQTSGWVDWWPGRPFLAGDDSGSMEMIHVTNWTKGDFFSTDFSGAVLGGDGGKGGRPSFVMGDALCDGWLTSRNMLPVVGKDAVGNYWIVGVLKKGRWEGIIRALDEWEAAA